MNWGAILPVVMLAGSNLVMNVAWYGHLKAPGRPLWLAVLMSWGLAFFEYWLAVPANRLGAKTYSLAQLKTLQEVLSLTAFVVVAWVLFGQKPGVAQVAGFALIVAGAGLVFRSPL
ncbi:MAG: DMT family protein [Sphingomonadales bacterium]|nr:DMT family protein [Sphingomonadales bacterium]